MKSSMRIIAITMLISAAVGCHCFQRNSNPRRDVGRVQANVGSGQTDIFPRTNTQPYSPATINGPLTTPTSNAQGARLAVAGPPPGTPVFNQGVPAQPAVAVAGPMVPAQGVVAAPGVMPVQTHVFVAQPAPIAMVQAIPVVFNTPTTRSSFVPAGAVAVAPAGVAIPMATGPAMIPQGVGGFLSDQTPPQGMQLMPRLPDQPQPMPVQPQVVQPQVTQPQGIQPPTTPPAGTNSLPNRLPTNDRPPTKSTQPLEQQAPPVDIPSPLVPALPEGATTPPAPTKTPGQGTSRLNPVTPKLDTPAPPTEDLSMPDLKLPSLEKN